VSAPSLPASPFRPAASRHLPTRARTRAVWASSVQPRCSGCRCNRVPSLKELFAKPLHPPKLVSFLTSLLSGAPEWGQLHEGSVQLRPLAALWGSPAIRLHGIHVNPHCTQAKAALAAAPFMLEWLQLGIMEIYLPSPLAVLLPTPLSPGVKLTVKDVYLRVRTYGTSMSLPIPFVHGSALCPALLTGLLDT
jgi:hypothetical protein